MSEPYDTSWDIRRTEHGTLPESDEVFERKFSEWQRRDWSAWLQVHLTFPFVVVRKEGR